MTATVPTSVSATAAGATRCPDCTDGLGQPRPVRPGSFRERVHRNREVALAWRIGVFTVGLLFVALGIALTVLPGPLTIPPILLGLWVWSTEFDWAEARMFPVWARTWVSEAESGDPLASPAKAQLSGLPPLLIQVGGAEMLHDQVIAFAMRSLLGLG